MQGPLENLPECSASPDRVAVLAVSSDHQDQVSLRNIFARTRWQLFEAPNCEVAQPYLERSGIGVVLCDAELPDGSWLDLLNCVSRLPAPPMIIVSSRRPGSALWAEVLNHGAYDVLAKPFDRSEVIRIVSLAWLYWRERLAPAANRRRPESSSGAYSRSATA